MSNTRRTRQPVHHRQPPELIPAAPVIARGVAVHLFDLVSSCLPELSLVQVREWAAARVAEHGPDLTGQVCAELLTLMGS